MRQDKKNVLDARGYYATLLLNLLCFFFGRPRVCVCDYTLVIVYGGGVEVHHGIACDRRSRPRGRVAHEISSGNEIALSVLCAVCTTVCYVCSARTLRSAVRLRSGGSMVILSKYRIVSECRNRDDTRYGTIFRYDLSETSIRYPTLVEPELKQQMFNSNSSAES